MCLRPSGTEPKLKVYVEVVEPVAGGPDGVPRGQARGASASTTWRWRSRRPGPRARPGRSCVARDRPAGTSRRSRGSQTDSSLATPWGRGRSATVSRRPIRGAPGGASGVAAPPMLFPTIDFAVFFLVVFTGSWLLRPYQVPWRVFILCASIFFYGYWYWQARPCCCWRHGRRQLGLRPGGVPRPRRPRANARARSRWLVRGRGRRRPRRARLLQVRRLLRSTDRRAAAVTRRARGRADAVDHPAHRHLVLHVPGHQLRDRHRPGRVDAGRCRCSTSPST